jgi:uncharacterized membrane protein YeiB
VALFGIIAANMRGFNSPAAAYFHPDVLWPSLPGPDHTGLIDCFITGKF